MAHWAGPGDNIKENIHMRVGVVNPRRACARVTVVVVCVCLCVCVSV